MKQVSVIYPPSFTTTTTSHVPGLHSNTTLRSLWSDVMGNTFLGTQYKVQVRATDQDLHCGNPVTPFIFGYVDGLARAQILHGFVTLLDQEVWPCRVIVRVYLQLAIMHRAFGGNVDGDERHIGEDQADEDLEHCDT